MRFAETLINDHYDDFTESEIFLKLVRGACRIMDLIEEHPDVFPPPAIQEGALAAASTDQGADVYTMQTLSLSIYIYIYMWVADMRG